VREAKRYWGPAEGGKVHHSETNIIGIDLIQGFCRYTNMDYIVMSALVGITLMLLTLSYDIACQWKKNLPTWMKKLPERIRLDQEAIEVQYGLPVWHASSHDEDCWNESSLSFLRGVGKSDGEGIERFWAFLNGTAFYTKDAGLAV
jgi:hypothetical protein